MLCNYVRFVYKRAKRFVNEGTKTELKVGRNLFHALRKRRSQFGQL